MSHKSPLKGTNVVTDSLGTTRPELSQYIGRVTENEISKERGNDAFAKDKNIFTPGGTKEDAHAFLLHLRRVLESKVRGRHINNCHEVIDCCVAYLCPVQCVQFLATYEKTWRAAPEPHVAFVQDFCRMYMPDVTASAHWKKFCALMEGPRLTDLTAMHTFLIDVRAAHSNLGAGFFAEESEILRLRRRIDQTIVFSLLSSKLTGFTQWLNALEEAVCERLRETSVDVARAPSSLSPSIVVPARSQAQHEPMHVDIVSVVSEVLAALDRKKGKSASEGASGSGGGPRCWKCNKRGHVQRDCPDKKN